MDSISKEETLGSKREMPKVNKRPTRPTIRKYFNKKEKELELL